MKDLILCSGLYQDINSLSMLISSMEFEDAQFGKEIKNFHYIPNGLQEYFCSLLNTEIEIQMDSGLFRKPSNVIHFENFYQHGLWLGIVALENTVLTIHKQENINSYFDVADKLETFIPENCFDHSKWVVDNTINISENNVLFVRPWSWISLQENSLIQLFLINQKIENNQ